MKPLFMIMVLLVLIACTPSLLDKIDRCQGDNFCLQKLALSEDNINVCDYSKERDACIMNFALDKNDYGICDSALAKEECIFQIATLNNDIGACDRLYRLKAQCIYNINVSESISQ